MTDIDNFIVSTLKPIAAQSLQDFYKAYCSGEDIGIEEKNDASPASRADRQTEKLLRKAIMDAFPDHGILGEEYGAYHIDRPCCWVLDPLDGTREFLAKKSGYFGTLIGFMQDGKLKNGCILDPLSGEYCIGEKIQDTMPSTITKDKPLIACTNPDTMFTSTKERVFIDTITSDITFLQYKNALGFADFILGRCDAVMERDLAFHDIAGVLPPVLNTNAIVTDFQGRSYHDRVFNLEHVQDQKFDIIAARDKNVMTMIQDTMKKAGLS